jgi:hypothetical protein
VLPLILCVSVFVVSQAGELEKYSKDLGSRWHIYDNELNKFVPFVPAGKINIKHLILPVGRYEFPGARISFDLPGGAHLFVNGNYLVNAEGKKTASLNLDSLFNVYSYDTLIFGIYYSVATSVPAKAGLLITGSEENNPGISNIEIGSRQFLTDLNEFVIIGLMITIGYVAFLFNYDQKLFRQYFNVARIFSRPETDDFLERSRPLAGTDMLFIILEALLLGFYCNLLMYRYHSDYELTKFNFLSGIFYWILLSLVLLIWNFIKFSFIRNLARVLQIREVIRIQFFESKRITVLLLLINTILAIVLLFGFKIHFSVYLDFLMKSLVIGAVLRFLIVSLKILNNVPYKKMYIISYLCTSELIPVVIGLKIILDTSLEKLI